MLTVPEAARRTKRDPETVRRWIRSGRLRATKVGTQHMIDEADLQTAIDSERQLLRVEKPVKISDVADYSLIREIIRKEEPAAVK